MDVAVVADFDGTVTEGEVSRMLFERFSDRDWRGFVDAYDRGEMSARDCIAAQFSTLDVADDEVRDFVRTHAQLREGFLEFVSHIRGLGFPIAIVSEGLDLYINEVLQENGVDYVNVFCNEAARDAEGRIEMVYPHSSDECDECGNCKADLVEALRTDGNYVVFIGNGITDLCPAKKANIVFARDRLARNMQQEGLPFVLFEDFHDIMESWDSVVAHG